MSRAECRILCEGFHDRAFLRGLLLRQGCTDPGAGSSRRDVMDDNGIAIKGRGHFGFRTKSGNLIRVAPCHSKDNLHIELASLLKLIGTRPIATIVVCRDADTKDAEVPAPESFTQPLLGVAHNVFSDARAESDGSISVDGGACRIISWIWAAADAPTPALPKKQTLERVICAALLEVHPQRGPAIESWLASRPCPPSDSVKQFSWSQMAGWYPERGCENFFEALWEDAQVAAALEKRLCDVGIWPTICKICG